MPHQEKVGKARNQSNKHFDAMTTSAQRAAVVKNKSGIIMKKGGPRLVWQALPRKTWQAYPILVLVDSENMRSQTSQIYYKIEKVLTSLCSLTCLARKFQTSLASTFQW